MRAYGWVSESESESFIVRPLAHRNGDVCVCVCVYVGVRACVSAHLYVRVHCT